MRVDEAMEQLDAIHAQVLRSETYRGYRAASVAGTGLIALLAALVQDLWLPVESATAFAWFWIAVAGLAGGAVAAELLLRSWREGHRARRSTRLALGQLVPALVVGCVLAVLFLGGDQARLLPGLWTLCLGLGVVASRPYLPPAVWSVALFYLLSGAALLHPALSQPVPSPWAMGAVFGLGQLLSAFVLHRAEEQRRGHA